MKAVLSIILSLCLFLNVAIPTYAENESNTLGVTFSASLDTPVLTVSDVDQTVTMRVTASKGVLLEGIGAGIIWDDALNLTSITNEDSRIDFTGSVNLENGTIAWDGTDNLDQLDNVTSIAVVTFTVPANTPAGEYTVGIQNIELCQNYGDIWERTASAQAVLTITEEASTAGYTAGITTLTGDISVEDKVTVNVGVSHDSDTTYAAGEIVVQYDNTMLSFNEASSTLGTATAKNNAGTLTLEDYGTDKNFSTDAYVLVFDAIADGETAVTLASAAFVDKEDAVKSDLISAALSPASIALTIKKQSYTINIPDIFDGPTSVTKGDDYTFSVTDSDNYKYDSISATMAGTTVNVVDNGDGTYTIKNVTGELVITGTRTEKTYNVTFSGNAADDITDGAVTATFNTNYTFTMPSAEGWAYSLESITIGGNTFTGYSVADSIYTIPGSAITGEIVITVSKSATEASVTVEGTGAGAAYGYETKVNIGEDYTLTIVPEAGYSYTVTATMGDKVTTVIDNGNNTYTIENVTGNVIFSVERTVIIDGVTVTQYLPLDGTVMWLIQNNTTVADGKVPTYDGVNMFWSEKYNAYCYLEIAQTLATDDAAKKISIADGTASDSSFNEDVNMTEKVDASDAQLVYNMYNAMYDNFTADLTIEKFLRADVNGDGKINVEDAAAIIADILK